MTTRRELIAGLGGEHVVEFSLERLEATSPPDVDWHDLPTVNDVRHDDQ